MGTTGIVRANKKNLLWSCRRSPSQLYCVVLLALLVGCAGLGDISHDQDASSTIIDLARETSEFQSQLLEDGVLTYAEYEQAMLATWSCVDSLGFEVLPIQTIDEDGTLGFVYGGTESEGELARADECFDEYLNDVSLAWAITIAPSEKEMQDRWRRFQECLTSFGHNNVPIPTNRAELGDLVSGFGQEGAHCEAEAGLVATFVIEHE